ncbi:MAG: type III secretion system export apparatus subunit SctU [Pseudomonadota bacterium]
MAGSSSGEKTEPPTPKRIRDARKKGQVARSKEIAGTLGMILLLSYVWFGGATIRDDFGELILAAGNSDSLPFESALSRMLSAASTVAMQVLVPVIGIAILAAVFGNMVQVGVLFAGEAVKPSLNKLNPLQAIKKIFSVKNLIDFGKNIIKVALLGLIVFLVVRDSLGDLVNSGACGLPCTAAVFSKMFTLIVVLSMAIFIIAAGVDYALERWQWIKGLKMTKDEVKREYKEMEGDPLIKGRRRQLHRELVNSDSVQATRGANAVVTNPTHIAVALRYDRSEAPLPVIVSKGENLIAKQIVEVAEEFDVPIMQNIDLARALYDQGEIDQLIPKDLIEPVAEVLRWVRRLEQERRAGAA